VRPGNKLPWAKPDQTTSPSKYSYQLTFPIFDFSRPAPQTRPFIIQIISAIIGIAKSFFRYETPYNPPCPHLKKGGELQGIAVKVPL
jgi:hypothetical protein